MNDEEFKALKATMPWTERIIHTPRGGQIQIINNRGMEVPLFDITKFLVMITAKLTKQTIDKEAQ